VEFSRPIYAGNAILKIKSSDSIKVVTVRTTAFDKAVVGSGSASVEEAEAVKGECESRYRERADL
jgi:electron transfer flavoprotein alpha subunit